MTIKPTIEHPEHVPTFTSTGTWKRRSYRVECSCGEYASPGWAGKTEAQAAHDGHVRRVIAAELVRAETSNRG